MGLYMHPKQSISGVLPMQETLSLGLGAALSGLLLGADGLDARSKQRQAQGTPSAPAVYTEIVDDPADAPAGPMGSGSCAE